MDKQNSNVIATIATRLRASMFNLDSYALGGITLLAMLVGIIAGYAAIGVYIAIAHILDFSFGVEEA
ncbi:MAG: hypothetical protein JKY57_04150, partial [Kordiimonadaceae bacterium]|nr:hypothetical protein [Kordiimonadaceae bacterium]